MKILTEKTMGRRELLIRTVPACAVTCLGLGALPGLAGALAPTSGDGILPGDQEQHKFDRPMDPPPPLTQRNRVRMQYGAFAGLVQTLRREMEELELIRILKEQSAGSGRQLGQAQAGRAPDNSFQTFVAQFRPPRYENALTHEVVVDAEDAFELKVTECVWAEAFREMGIDGEVGHAAVCNMDYHVPQAFNPDIHMERTKTLMQGHDCCNHRYLLRVANQAGQ